MPLSTPALSPELSVSAQIRPEDLPALAAAGYRAVVCNRPDGEGAKVLFGEKVTGLRHAILPPP